MTTYQGMTIGGLLRSSSVRFPGRTALVFGTERLSYLALETRANRLARGLIGRGAARGIKVALLARNSHAFVIAHFAIAKSGAALVPVNYLLGERELADVLDHCDARFLLFSEEYADRIDSIRARLSKVELFVSLGEKAPSWATPINVLTGNEFAEMPEAEVSENDDYLVMYTSGTSGNPKGVVLTHRARVHQAIQCIVDHHIDSDQVILLPVPLFHTGGLNTCLVPALLAGATVVLFEKFDVIEVLRAIERERVTFLFTVPGPVMTMVESPELHKVDIGSLRWLMYGGAPMPQEMLRRVSARLPGVRFIQGYGATEASQLLVLDWRDHARKSGTTGRVSAFAEIRLAGERGREVTIGEPGEILARGPFVMKEYHRDPEATADALRGGWLHTGDIGSMDAEGFITIVDRKKDLIISGGENIYPREIEELLYAHPAVQDAAVFGVPDERWGENVCAAIVRKPGASLTEGEVVDYCRRHLAAYKKPKLVEFLDSLPRTPIGKIAKQALRDRHWRGWSRRI